MFINYFSIKPCLFLCCRPVFIEVSYICKISSNVHKTCCRSDPPQPPKFTHFIQLYLTPTIFCTSSTPTSMEPHNPNFTERHPCYAGFSLVFIQNITQRSGTLSSCLEYFQKNTPQRENSSYLDLIKHHATKQTFNQEVLLFMQSRF